MALNSNLKGNEEKGNLGFSTALYIDVPNWDKELNISMQSSDVNSNGNTPDKMQLLDTNKSLITNLISHDLMKKLECESPFRNKEVITGSEQQKNPSVIKKLNFEDCEFDEEKNEASVSKCSENFKEIFGFEKKEGNNSKCVDDLSNNEKKFYENESMNACDSSKAGISGNSEKSKQEENNFGAKMIQENCCEKKGKFFYLFIS